MTELDARTRFQMARSEATRYPLSRKVYEMATAALAEQDAEITRLKVELAQAGGRSTLHATGAQCDRIIASGEADAEEPGTLLCSTDDTRTWERTAAGWQLR